MKAKGAPLTIGDVFESEKYYFEKEDSAVFIPAGEEVESLGSSDDELYVPEGEGEGQSEEKKGDLIELGGESDIEGETVNTPSTVIEIGSIEPEMEEKLGVA